MTGEYASRTGAFTERATPSGKRWSRTTIEGTEIVRVKPWNDGYCVEYQKTTEEAANGRPDEKWRQPGFDTKQDATRWALDYMRDNGGIHIPD